MTEEEKQAEFEQKVFERGMLAYQEGRPFDPNAHPQYVAGWQAARDIDLAAKKLYAQRHGYYY